MGNFLVFFEDVSSFVVVFSWYFLGGLSGGGGVGLERDHRVREGSRWARPANQTLSITVPWLPHHCSAAMCMRRFSEQKTMLIAYIHIQGVPKNAAGAMVHLLIC